MFQLSCRIATKRSRRLSKSFWRKFYLCCPGLGRNRPLLSLEQQWVSNDFTKTFLRQKEVIENDCSVIRAFPSDVFWEKLSQDTKKVKLPAGQCYFMNFKMFSACNKEKEKIHKSLSSAITGTELTCACSNWGNSKSLSRFFCYYMNFKTLWLTYLHWLTKFISDIEYTLYIIVLLCELYLVLNFLQNPFHCRLPNTEIVLIFEERWRKWDSTNFDGVQGSMNRIVPVTVPMHLKHLS